MSAAVWRVVVRDKRGYAGIVLELDDKHDEDEAVRVFERERLALLNRRDGEVVLLKDALPMARAEPAFVKPPVRLIEPVNG